MSTVRCEFRQTAIAGIFEQEGDFPVAITFSESWNGEVMDFVIERGNEKERFTLSVDEAHALAVILAAAGYIDLTEVSSEADRTRRRMKDQEQAIRSIRESAGLTDED